MSSRLTLVMMLTSLLKYSHCIRYVDLTHVHNGQSLTWANNPPFNFTILWRGKYFNDDWMELNYFCTPEHMGTHFDAPSHFSKTGWRVHEVPIDKMIGPGVIVDVKSKVASNRDYRLLVEDLINWEKQYGKIPDKAAVIMNSGWDKFWHNVSLAFGTDMYNDTSSYHFPGWHQDAVQWLITNRNINILGVDTPSTDYGHTSDFPVHVLATAHNIIMLESIANLDDIPASGTTIYAPVIKLYEGSGAPVRVFAAIDDVTSIGFRVESFPLSILMLSVVLNCI